MEGEGSFETAESREEEVIQALKTYGIEDPGTRDLLNQWLTDEESRVAEATDYKVAQMELNLRRARVYAEGGYIQEAIDGLRDDSDQASNDRSEALFHAMQNAIRELKKLL